MPVEEKKALNKEIRRLEAEKGGIELMCKRNAELFKDKELELMKLVDEGKTKIEESYSNGYERANTINESVLDAQKETYEGQINKL